MYKEIQEINHEQAYTSAVLCYPSVGVIKNLVGVIWEAHLSHDFTYAFVTE